MDQVHVVYSLQAMPPAMLPSIFLAGPTPRQTYVRSWRPNALRMIRRQQKDLAVLYPEPVNVDRWDPENPIYVRWERAALMRANIILFWMDRKLAIMPGFRSNTQWGFWTSHDPGRLVLAYPPGAPGMRAMRDDAECYQVPIVHTLSAGIKLAVDKATAPR